MNTKNTWSIVATAVALFAFIYFFERGQSGPPAGPVQHRLLNKLQQGLVSRIEVQVGTNSVTLERTNSTWRMIAPVVYPAWQPQAKNFLDACAELNYTTTIPATELAKSPHGLADYGLQPPRAQFTLVQNNERIEVKIGNETPVGGQRYVQLGDEIVAYLVDAKIGNLLPPTSASWRDRFLMPGGMVFNRIEIHAGNRVTEFQRDDTNQMWRITKPITARADNVRIKDMIQQWRDWDVKFFATDNPLATELEKFGFKPPELELLLGQGTNHVFGLQFGLPLKDQQDILALRSSHTNLVVVRQEPWVETLRSQWLDFRERRLLTFAPSVPDLIEVQSDERFRLQRQTNGMWMVLDETNFVVDTVLVNEMLMNLNNLDVLDFEKDNVTDWKDYGLAVPAHSYTLSAGGTNAATAGTNAIIAQLELGKVEGIKIFARRVDESSAYSLLDGVARKLPRTLFHLRDRRVWKFNTNDVKRISIEQEGRKQELVRNAKSIWSLGEGFQGMVNPFAVEETVHRLGEMQAVRWIERGPAAAGKYGVNTQSHGITLTLQRNGGPEEKLMLRIGNLTPTRNAYAAIVLNGEPVVFEMPQVLHEYIATYLNAPRLPGSK
ncbi:MAG: hypothetical protein K0Q55_1790 [Verrucomicrobia bacterium]|jgi:hypothetical protein|nr:hypothetical protein [Verrucomicrobiota bacterium]